MSEEPFERHQKYNTSLKSLVQQHAAEILPCLCPGVVFKGELDIEIIRPTMRADRVYLVWYRNAWHILHIEFESSNADEKLAARIHTYNAVIYQKHKLPVLSIIIYPFKATMPVSPLCIKSGDDDILTFHYRTLALWELDARQYVREHNLAMYVLLPTMENADAPLVLQAIQEMADNYREETTKFYQQLVWMEILMRRSGAMSAEAKETVYRRLSMFERIFEEDPKVQAITAEAKKKSWQQGMEKGEIKTLRTTTLAVIAAHFPGLLEVAERQLAQIDDPAKLQQLFNQILTAPNGDAVYKLLNNQ